MDVNRMGTGTKIAAVAALVLLIVMFLSWFQLDGITGHVENAPEGVPDSIEISGSDLEAQASDAGESTSKNAWQSFGVIDIVLVLAIVAAIGTALLQASGSSLRLPVSPGVLVAGLGLLAFVLVFFRLISPPDLVDAFGGTGDIPDGVSIDTDVGRQIGVFLGFIATAGIAYGGWRAMQEESTSLGGQVDAIPAGGAPPPPAQ